MPCRHLSIEIQDLKQCCIPKGWGIRCSAAALGTTIRIMRGVPIATGTIPITGTTISGLGAQSPQAGQVWDEVRRVYGFGAGVPN